MTKEKLLNSMPWARVIKPNTKKAEELHLEYLYARRQWVTDIHSAYKTCSADKERSFENIVDRALMQGVETVFISGHNCFSYSAIYAGALDDHTEFLVKDTKDNTFVVLFED